MPARSQDGLAPDCSLIALRELASPTSPVVDKFTRSRAVFPLVSDTSPASSTSRALLYLEGRSFYHNSDTLHADHRHPSVTIHQSEPAGDRDRPAAQPAARSGNCVRRAERPEGATSSRRSCQRATAASSPERPPSAPRRAHKIDQPEARACPRPGMGERHSRPKGGHRQRCGAGRCCPRWSA